MFVPPTLWPFNVQDVLADCLAALEKRKRLNSRQRLLIDLLPEPPGESICAAVAGHELHVQTGTYENLVKTQAKYSQNELAIKTDPDFAANGLASKPPSTFKPTATIKASSAGP